MIMACCWHLFGAQPMDEFSRALALENGPGKQQAWAVEGLHNLYPLTLRSLPIFRLPFKASQTWTRGHHNGKLGNLSHGSAKASLAIASACLLPWRPGRP